MSQTSRRSSGQESRHDVEVMSGRQHRNGLRQRSRFDCALDEQNVLAHDKKERDVVSIIV